MRQLPFQRIAIFQPSLVLSETQPSLAKPQMWSELEIWLNQAVQAGADAVYARLHKLAGPVQQALLLYLASHPKLALLAPGSLQFPGLRPAAYHFRGSDTLATAPSQDILRGRSCHDRNAVEKAISQGMDYVFLSPVFSTQTHPEAEPLGLNKLRVICSEVDIPVIALGGIHPEREKTCRLAGASGIAAIGMFLR
ncbi:MAG TPA: thiamine phosphate synthase [Bacteroidetes bacterium]|nr:thiamine phosphate synthase [Bacteroidota bacterium]